MQKMDRVHLHRAAQIDGDLCQIIQAADQFIQGVIVVLIQYKPKTPFVLVFADEHHGAHEIRIFQKRICN